MMSLVRRILMASASGLLLLVTTLAPSTPFAAASTTTTSDGAVRALASQLVLLSAKVNSSNTVKAEASPVIQAVASSFFDWDQAIFGSDILNAQQQALAGGFIPTLKSVATFSITSQSQAITLIGNLVASVQQVDPWIATNSVVTLLQNIESDVIFSVVPGIRQQMAQNPTMTESQLATALEALLHQNIAAAVEASGSAFVQLFAGDAGGSPSGGAVLSGSAGRGGTDSGAGNGSSGNNGPGSATGSNGAGSGFSTGTGTGTTSSASSGAGNGRWGSGSGTGSNGGGKNSGTSTGTSKTGGSKSGATATGKGTKTAKHASKNQPGIYIDGRLAANQAPEIKVNKQANMSLESVMWALKQGHIASRWNGAAWRIVLPITAGIKWPNVPHGKGNVEVFINGRLVFKAGKKVVKDQAGRATTYLPIGTLVPVLRLMGLHVTWNGSELNVVENRAR